MKKEHGAVIRGITLFCNCAATYRHSELFIVWYFDQTTDLTLAPLILLTATVTEFEMGFKVGKNYMSDP
jgi:hypothetical protein